jgi:hypothetical protein
MDERRGQGAHLAVGLGHLQAAEPGDGVADGHGGVGRGRGARGQWRHEKGPRHQGRGAVVEPREALAEGTGECRGEGAGAVALEPLGAQVDLVLHVDRAAAGGGVAAHGPGRRQSAMATAASV